jgi:hypothetical protein
MNRETFKTDETAGFNFGEKTVDEMSVWLEVEDHPTREDRWVVTAYMGHPDGKKAVLMSFRVGPTTPEEDELLVVRDGGK